MFHKQCQVIKDSVLKRNAIILSYNTSSLSESFKLEDYNGYGDDLYVQSYYMMIYKINEDTYFDFLNYYQQPIETNLKRKYLKYKEFDK